MAVRIQKVLYTAEALVEGGRGGRGRTSDGRLDTSGSQITPYSVATRGIIEVTLMVDGLPVVPADTAAG